MHVCPGDIYDDDDDDDDEEREVVWNVNEFKSRICKREILPREAGNY